MNGVKIVIADDDASQVALLERLVASAGHTALTCDNGATAFELVQQHAPVLLIADWEMPGLTGLELCRKIRASQASDGTYILLRTGNNEQAQIVAGLDAGADDYLVKTRSQTELLARVRAGARQLKAHTATGPTRTFSTKVLTALALATLGISALAGWNLWSTQSTTVRTLSESLRIRKLCGKIVHLDEVLTMSARMAAATGDLRWEDRYRGFEPELDDAIKMAIELAPSSFEGNSAAQTGAANITLVEMENRAFALVRQGQREEAGDRLLSEKYEEQKRVYASGIQAVLFDMNKRVEDQVNSDRTHMSVAVRAAAAALTVMGFVWLGMLLVVGRHMRERSRAEGALQQAYGELESRVAQRTTDLTCANEQLLAEIAQRKQVEEQQHRLAHAVEAAAEAIVLTDVQGEILQVNPAFTKITGYTADEAIGQTPSVLKSGKQNSEFYECMWRTIRSGEVWAGRLINQRKNGVFYVAELTIAPITSHGGTVTGYVGVQRDVTRQVEHEEKLAAARDEAEKARKEVEQANAQLLQADKMASIGQLAAGVAHEINNPIGFISSNLNSLGEYAKDLQRVLASHDELLQLCLGNPELNAKGEEVSKVREESDVDFILSDLGNLIKESVEGTKRVRDIVADLRDFSHVDSADVGEVEVNELLDKTINVAWNELKYKTEVVREYGEIPTIIAFGGKLGQVFLNLLVNAAQAIEERGTITVRTGQNDSHVWVEVEDTGCGMPPDVAGRVFEPFFTTKEVGQGTGMGLHLAYNIVGSHDGSIECKSTVGKGTTFRIELPIEGPSGVQEQDAAAQREVGE